MRIASSTSGAPGSRRMENNDLVWDPDRLIEVFWDLCSPRERQVMYHIIQGMTVRELASHLGVSTTTVRQHLGVIKKKTEVYYAIPENC